MLFTALLKANSLICCELKPLRCWNDSSELEHKQLVCLQKINQQLF